MSDLLNISGKCVGTSAKLNVGGSASFALFLPSIAGGPPVAKILVTVDYADPGPEREFRIGEEYDVTITPKIKNDDNQKKEDPDAGKRQNGKLYATPQGQP